jgi:hypothetical protein
MTIRTQSSLTDSQAADFFLAPESTQQRHYEALRAFFVEGQPSHRVTQRFGYSRGTFRNLCSQFRHDPQKRATLFPAAAPATRAAPARDRVRELAVAMRKRNMSVYDIQHELVAGGHTISINALSVLLREEGFARLPRRRDDERPPRVVAEPAAVADIRTLSLAPRSFRTPLAGLFLFVPLMRDIRLTEVLPQAQLPGSSMIPAEQAVRPLLARKLLGKERKSHVMDLVYDAGSALFAGLNVVPKRAYLAGYSVQVTPDATTRLMAAWCTEVPRAGRTWGQSFDLDVHAVPANSEEEPLEKPYVSRRSRSQNGILTLLARDTSQRALCYARAGIPKADQAGEILRFVDAWQRQTGTVPKELVFDSRLTTYGHLQRLQQRGSHFITLRRRTRQMLAALWSRPAATWRRITLPALTRKFRTPKVLEERVQLRGYAGELRQVTVIELGHEEPTILLTNNFQIRCPALVTRYAQRMLIENGIADAINFFHLDALSSMVGLAVDFDLQITLMASTLYRLRAQRVGGGYAKATAKKLFRNLLDVSATVSVGDSEVVVQLDKRAPNPFLAAAGLCDRPTLMPWFGNKALRIQMT